MCLSAFTHLFSYYFLSPSLLFYWSLYLFYHILLFLQPWWAKSMHNAHHTQQKECKWKQRSFSMSAHISRCMCTTLVCGRVHAKDKVLSCLLDTHFSMDQVQKSSGFPQLQIITLTNGACFTQGLNLAEIRSNRRNQLSRGESRARWKKSSQEVGEGCISHSGHDCGLLGSYVSKGQVKLLHWDPILRGEGDKMCKMRCAKERRGISRDDRCQDGEGWMCHRT